jgi:hypothetical protein
VLLSQEGQRNSKDAKRKRRSGILPLLGREDLTTDFGELGSTELAEVSQAEAQRHREDRKGFGR